MNRTLQLATLGLIGAAMLGCAGQTTVMINGMPPTHGSGVLVSESRTVEGFNAVTLKGSSDVTIEIGEAQSVQVTADDNLLPLISTEVHDGCLVIGAQGSYTTRQRIKVAIVSPELREAEIHGSGDMNIQGVGGESLHLVIEGSGDINAAGTVDTARLVVDGSGDINASKLKARHVVAEVNGSGNIRAHADEELDAAVNGSGDIRYSGKPNLVNRAVSSGTIRHE
ncbi:MAG: DUF2807 domain-containing protein [Phycisphaerae bacterium]|nr:DUF2807 domain-containing protein [Phycisphaerae bacterium]